MKTTFLKEVPLLLIIAAPLVYLAYVWSVLPSEVPMHYNIEGNVDRYGSKSELVLVIAALCIVPYLIMLVIPKLDPKGKIEKMGSKYHQLKIVMVIFMSALASYCVYFVAKGGSAPPNGPIALISLFLAVLGNYFQSVRPNYFIGIRTPWTLENETVWRDTHRLAGRIWLVSGILLAVLSFFLEAKIFMPIFIGAIVCMTLIPIVYSYVKFREVKRQSGNV